MYSFQVFSPRKCASRVICLDNATDEGRSFPSEKINKRKVGEAPGLYLHAFELCLKMFSAVKLQRAVFGVMFGKVLDMKLNNGVKLNH